MDVQIYIQSGIIQDYCLGLLGADEMLQVEQYAADYPEIKGELQGFRQALEQYAMALAVAVPCGVKDKAMGMLDKLVKEEQGDQQ